MFHAPGSVFSGIEGVRSRFHVLLSRTLFRRYRACRVPVSCFALLDSFSAVRGRRVQFSCFAHPKPFWALPRAPSAIFIFFPPGLVLGGTEGISSRFYVLRSRTHFGRYRGPRVPFSCFALPYSFSCFALPDSFWAVLRALGPVFMFCSPGLVLGDTEGVRSRFLILRSRTIFRRYRGR
jgi:hypothetical protein